jgi:hypothetical protein
MPAGRLCVPCAILVACLLAGCGGGNRVPRLSALPLPAGTHVSLAYRSCNQGSNAFCALQLVVVGGAYRTSQEMLSAETQALRARKWVGVHAQTGLERAADSPGDHLRVTYATATGDLQGVELGWIKRARHVTVALSRTLFSHTSALSVLLQLGTA